MSTELHSYRRVGLSLQEASQAFAAVAEGLPAIAILYTPEKCHLARFADGQFMNVQGQPFDISRVYEARIFNENAELRWLNDPGPAKQHRSVILAGSDLAHKLADRWEKPQKTATIIHTLKQTYLLWGQGTGETSNGWSTLAMARVGALQVPVPNVPDKANVLLHSIEYLEERDHGNVVVFDERLIGLKIDSKSEEPN
jgi:CRISPR-associated protein (TIGR03984 family)